MSELENVCCTLCGKENSFVLVKSNGYNIVRCDDCGINYVNPRPKSEVLSDMVDEQTFKDTNNKVAVNAKNHTASAKGLLLVAQEELEHIHQYKKSGRLLDVGCGIGHLVKTARDSGWDAFGIEPSKERVEFGKEYFNIPIKKSTLEEYVPDVNEKYDVICMYNALSHLRDPLVCFQNISQMLVSDGLLVMRSGNKGDVTSAEQAKFWLDPWDAPNHLYWFSQKSVHLLAEKFDLKIISTLEKTYMEIAMSKSHLAKPGGAPMWIKRLFYSIPLLPRFFLILYNFTKGKKDQSRSVLYFLSHA